MSAARPKAMPKRLPAAGQAGGGPPWMSVGRPAEKSMNFGPSVRRLLARLSPERFRLLCVIVLAVASVALSVIGPAVIGRATDIIFTGVVSKHLAANSTPQQAVAAARAARNSNLADMLSHMHLVPGAGIDFTALGYTLLLVIGLYLVSSLFLWAQGYLLNDVVQGTVLRLRGEVEDKINRLPLRYFDQQPRGEILSRVTNDISNISQSLQQTLSQLLTSLLTVIGVVAMMFVLSPLLSIIALVTIPLAMIITKIIAKRSQRTVHRAVDPHRASEQPDRGGVHRARAREGLRTTARGCPPVRREEREAVRDQLRRAVRLRHHHAGGDVHRQSQLCAHRRDRRPACCDRWNEPRSRPGLHPVLEAVYPPAHAGRLHGEQPAVGCRVGGASLRSARCARATRRAHRGCRTPSLCTAASSSSMSLSATSPTSP